MSLANGRTYLAIPGPSVMPDRVLAAMQRPAPNIYGEALSDMTRGIVGDLRQYGKVKRGWVGIMIQEITPEVAESFNLPDTRGAFVTNVVPDGPADKAGIVRGDVILRFNNIVITHSIDLPRIAAEQKPGTETDLLLNRDGEEVRVRLILGEFPEPKSQTLPSQELLLQTEQ